MPDGNTVRKTSSLPQASTNTLTATPKDNNNSSKGLPPLQPPPPKLLDIKKESVVLKNSYNILKEYLAPASRYGALFAGAASFISAAVLNKQSESLDTFSSGMCKTSLGITSAYGLMQNAYKEKNILGTMGYASDIGTSLLASTKKTYFFRAIGSLLDQIPAMLQDISVRYKKEINEKYNKILDPNFNFTHFKGFGDSFEKSMYGIKLVFNNTLRDLKSKYRSEGLPKAALELFNKERADANLLLSSAGLLGSVIVGGLLGLEKTGRVARDIFGFHADYAVAIRACSKDPETGKPAGKGGNAYGLAGALYGGAGLLDLISVFDTERNWHYASLGLDRFAGCGMVNAQSQDAEPQHSTTA